MEFVALSTTIKYKNSSDMEDKIFDIVTDLIREDISKDEAIEKLLVLYSVSKCAHDFIDIDYKIKQCVKCKEYLDLLD